MGFRMGISDGEPGGADSANESVFSSCDRSPED